MQTAFLMFVHVKVFSEVTTPKRGEAHITLNNHNKIMKARHNGNKQNKINCARTRALRRTHDGGRVRLP